MIQTSIQLSNVGVNNNLFTPSKEVCEFTQKQDFGPQMNKKIVPI